MPRYFEVNLEGDNVELQLEGKERRSFGFFTTRWVKANNRGEAERLSEELVWKEIRNKSLHAFSGDSIRVWTTAAREIELSAWDGETGEGFTFFPSGEGIS